MKNTSLPYLTIRTDIPILRAFPIFLFALVFSLSAQGQINYYEQSLNYFNQGNSKGALESINRHISNYPQHEDARMLRAFFYLQLGEKEKALSDYTVILEANPNQDDALSNRALIFMELGEYQNALTDINKRLEEHPNDWSIYFDRGYCYGLNDDHNLAIKDFDKSIALNPDHAASYANRGFSKINDLTNEGLIRPAPSQCKDACLDLKKALTMGDSTVVKTIKLYCPEQ